MEYEINHKGQTYKSKSGFELLSDTEYQKIKEEWYKKPDFQDVLMEMSELRHGGTQFGTITQYYFQYLMDEAVKYHSKWSVNDVINYKPLLSVFVDKTKKNDKVFTSNSLKTNLDTAFRLAGKGIASRVSQFPLKTFDKIIQKYNVNNNYYDYSCGWGARLACSIKNKVHYYGTDPNYLLVPQLKQFAEDFKRTQLLDTVLTDIRCQGSEIFVPEWENKMGLAFSSPPYFLLEDYKYGNQSYKAGTSYRDWLNKYLYPTMKNIKRYLIDDGFFIVNIKDFDKYTLEKDTVHCAEFAGFYLYGTDTLSQAKRVSGIAGTDEYNIVDVDEKIYVFAKKGFTPKTVNNVQGSLFDIL